STAAQTPRRKREALVIVHLGNVMCREPLQEARGFREIKLFVAGLNADEETVRRRMAEAMRIEDRVMRLRQPVKREHSKHGEERSTENGQLKCDGDEGRPAIE